MESFEGSSAKAEQKLRNPENTLTIRVILGWYFKHRREGLVIFIYRGSDPFCNLEDSHPVSTYNRTHATSEHTCWLIKSMAISLRPVNSLNAASIVDTCVSSKCKRGASRVTNLLTTIHDDKILLLVWSNLANACKEYSRYGVLG